MIYVIEKNGKLVELDIPDGARIPTEDDKLTLEVQKQAESEKLEVLKQRNEKRRQKGRLLAEMNALKLNLDKTDYQAIKFLEGKMPAEEYDSIGKQREEWRVKYNELEAEYNAIVL